MNLKILKRNKAKALFVTYLLLLISVLFLDNVWLTFSLLLSALFILTNIFVYKKNAYVATHMFTTIGRNYECLVIGDDINTCITSISNSLYVTSPSDRSQLSIELLIKRLYSLIDEDKGKIIVCVRNPNKMNSIDVFDYPYLHENTLSSMNVKFANVKMRLPFLFHFVGSTKLLLGIKRKGNLELIDCPSNAISCFCGSRKIKLEFYKIN